MYGRPTNVRDFMLFHPRIPVILTRRSNVVYLDSVKEWLPCVRRWLLVRVADPLPPPNHLGCAEAVFALDHPGDVGRQIVHGQAVHKNGIGQAPP
jgi:hypothetical protein